MKSVKIRVWHKSIPEEIFLSVEGKNTKVYLCDIFLIVTPDLLEKEKRGWVNLLTNKRKERESKCSLKWEQNSFSCSQNCLVSSDDPFSLSLSLTFTECLCNGVSDRSSSEFQMRSQVSLSSKHFFSLFISSTRSCALIWCVSVIL